MTNSLALQLYAAGLGVFPCGAHKGPAIPKDTDWREWATQPPASQRWPTGIVGVPIPPGVVVLDLDTYKGATREQVDAALGVRLPWDQALIQHTLHGGQHYAFAVDWPVQHGSNKAGVKGLDTRVTGKGYIATGDGYTPAGFGVYRMLHPSALPRLPDACRALLEHVDHQPFGTVTLPEGNRDIDTIRQALSLLDPGCGRDEWRSVGFALRHQFHDDESTGLAIFDEWSRGALTPTRETPENYSAETIEGQWYSFKPEGSGATITIGTVFKAAILKGWVPPAGIDTATAFGGTAASADQFDELVDRITEQGGNPKSTNDLRIAIQALQCNELQRGILMAALHRELKDADLMTKDMRKQLEGQNPPQASGTYAKNHTENAATFIDSQYPNQTLCRSQQIWYTYDGKSWVAVDDDDMKHQLAMAMASSKPQHATVGGTYNMMSEYSNRPGPTIGDIPPGLILMQNGVLDLNTGRLLPHSKEYFTTNILPYHYTPQATCNTWGQFLLDIFEGDWERLYLLQEWFGYMMTTSYDYHAVMVLLGPPRCGKGTIGKVLQLLVGEQNFSGGSLRSFTSDKFIDSLRTKPVMFIGDAEKRIPPNTVGHITERVKSISGNDAVQFDRIYKTSLTERLPTRVTIAGNNVPVLFDDSGALASRLKVLPFNVSYLGREDPGLFDRLAQDIEGIAIWALQGLARLKLAGRFTLPAISQAEIEYINEAYSPLQQYFNAVCATGGSAFVSSADVYASYRTWAVLNQEDRILARRAFISSFRDMSRGKGVVYGRYRPTSGGDDRQPGFKGLTLRIIGDGTAGMPLTAVK